jgi:hypothetical protein
MFGHVLMVLIGSDSASQNLCRCVVCVSVNKREPVSAEKPEKPLIRRTVRYGLWVGEGNEIMRIISQITEFLEYKINRKRHVQEEL